MLGPPSRPRAPVIGLAMTDADVVARVAGLLGCKVHAVVDRRKPSWRPVFQLRTRGANAAAWMSVLKPLMSERRRGQIERALACYEPRTATKLQDDAVRAALALLAGGTSVKEAAERFGVSVWCIYDLRSGRTHKRLRTAARAYQPSSSSEDSSSSASP